MELRNRFGWSISRESMFDTCPRRYYFHYYVSWGGWNARAPVISREAFKLKRLVSLPLWRGQLVHYVAGKVLQSMKAKGRIPARGDVVDYILERFARQYSFSESRRYLTEPKQRGGRLNIDWLALIDHEYGRLIEPQRLAGLREECVRAVQGLFQGPVLGAVALTDSSTWIIEDLDHAEFSQTFTVAGAVVYVKTDFLYRDRDGALCIIDWKTNRNVDRTNESQREESETAVQLGVYGYYAATVLGVPVESIRLYEVNLLDGGTVTEHTVREESIDRFKRHIEAGIARLSSVLVGGDRGRNEPGPPERFPTIENGRCARCNFYRICKEEGGAPRLP